MCLGCSGGRATTDTGVLTFDADMLDDSAVRPDAGPRDTGTLDSAIDASADATPTACGSPPATTVAGVLTPFAGSTFLVSPSQFRLISFNVKMTDDGDTRGPLSEAYAEFQNTGSTVECSFLTNVFIGTAEFFGLPTTPPWRSEFGSVTDCVGPGEVGVWEGLSRDLEPIDLELPLYVDLDLRPNGFGTHTRAFGPNVTSESVVMTDEGYAIAASLNVVDTIWNFGYDAYPKDERGVIIDELLAFPGELGTLSAGSVIPFETSSTECPITSFLSYFSWIDGAESLGGDGAPMTFAPERIWIRNRVADLRRIRRGPP